MKRLGRMVPGTPISASREAAKEREIRRLSQGSVSGVLSRRSDSTGTHYWGGSKFDPTVAVFNLDPSATLVDRDLVEVVTYHGDTDVYDCRVPTAPGLVRLVIVTGGDIAPGESGRGYVNGRKVAVGCTGSPVADASMWLVSLANSTFGQAVRYATGLKILGPVDPATFPLSVAGAVWVTFEQGTG